MCQEAPYLFVYWAQSSEQRRILVAAKVSKADLRCVSPVVGSTVEAGIAGLVHSLQVQGLKDMIFDMYLKRIKLPKVIS